MKVLNRTIIIISIILNSILIWLNFKYSTVIVSGISMEPTFYEGDIILIEKTNNFKEGDIYVYQSDDKLIVHRLYKIIDDTLIFKGDNNDFLDLDVPKNQVKGRFVKEVDSTRYLQNIDFTVSLITIAMMCYTLNKDKFYEDFLEIREE